MYLHILVFFFSIRGGGDGADVAALAALAEKGAGGASGLSKWGGTAVSNQLSP
jgi:hypothetical protein